MMQWLRTLLAIIIIATFPININAITQHETEQSVNAGQKACDEGRYADAIKLLLKARNDARGNGWQYLNYRAAYNLGVAYFYISDYSDALHYYNEAYNICVNQKLGEEQRANVLNGIAGIYFNEGNWKKVEEITRKCLDNSLQRHDSTRVITYSSNLSLLFNKLGRLAESKKAFVDSRPYLKGCHSQLSIMSHKIVLAELCHLSGDYAAVESLAPEIVNSQYALAHDKTVVSGYMVDIYTQRHDTARAMQWVRCGEKFATADSKPEFYQILSHLFIVMGRPSLALAYKDSVIAYKDSMIANGDEKMLENEHVRFAVQEERNSMNDQLASMKSQRLVFFIIALICIIVIVVVLFAMRYMRLRAKQKRLVMELQLEKEKNERILAEQQVKETELVSHYQNEKMRDALRAKDQEVQINSRLRSLLKNDTKLDDFMVQFESLYPNFVHDLQQLHPDLTVSDVRFIAYLRMNLSNKEIAALLGITPDSCTRKKIRLSKRLGLKSSRELYNYIVSI